MKDMRVWMAAGLLGGLALLGLGLGGAAETTEKSDLAKMTKPQYDEDGKLVLPTRYVDWVFVGASIGLSYSEEVRREGPGLFHNVYIQPEAYRHYVETGKFPEKTMLVMENYLPKNKESINKHGYFPGDRVGLEVALKDHDQFEEGWAYFNFTNGQKPLKPVAKAFPKAVCYSCHSEHAQDDNVFVQFYPVLRSVKEGEESKL